MIKKKLKVKEFKAKIIGIAKPIPRSIEEQELEILNSIRNWMMVRNLSTLTEVIELIGKYKK
jgi:hypothetical protein